MKKQNNTFGGGRTKLIAAALLVLALAVTAVALTPISGADTEPTTAEAATVTLKYGSSGTLVKTMQTKLKKWGYYSGSVDGIFGSQTQAAVRYFQRVNGLYVDGIVGAKTAAAMGLTLTSTSSSSSTSSSDTYLLAKLVNAEARGEPYTGQVAVAAVVLNRVKSSSFPNTISGVIYQSYAFESVSNGQINLEPSTSCRQAAQDAMNGWDPTNGCLYFYNAANTTNAWMLSRPVHLVIGLHTFCL